MGLYPKMEGSGLKGWLDVCYGLGRRIRWTTGRGSPLAAECRAHVQAGGEAEEEEGGDSGDLLRLMHDALMTDLIPELERRILQNFLEDCGMRIGRIRSGNRRSDHTSTAPSTIWEITTSLDPC